MPEGPEITLLSQYLNLKLKNRIISKINIIDGQTFGKITNEHLMNNISHYSIDNIESKGKLLWFTLSSQTKTIFIISHLGLTGEWSFHPNKYNKISISIENKHDNKTYKLYYSDKLNGGYLIFTTDKVVLNEKINKLAPDLLKTNFDKTTFYNWLYIFMHKTTKRPNMLLGKILMNQNISDSIGSGIGNYLLAEILYHAKLSPCRTLKSLSKQDIFTLSYSIKYIMKLSYFNNKIGYMTNFGDFIDVHREGIINGKFPNYHDDIKLDNSDIFEYKVYQKKKDPYGNDVINDRNINKNRSTWWVKEIQK